MGSLQRITVNRVLLFRFIFDQLLLDGALQRNFPKDKVTEVKAREMGAVKSVKDLQWPVNRVCEIPGDVFLGGLHMIHHRDDSWLCGPIMPQVFSCRIYLCLLKAVF